MVTVAGGYLSAYGEAEAKEVSAGPVEEQDGRVMSPIGQDSGEADAAVTAAGDI